MRQTGLLLAASVLACSHSEPFRPADQGTNQPFEPGPPARLTANRGNDGDIAFTADGKYLIYRKDISGTQSCLALMRTGRARDSTWICPPREDFVADRYGIPALSSSGQLAFTLTRRLLNGSLPFYQGLLVAPLADLRDTLEIVPVPFTTPDGLRHDTVTRAAWLRGDTLAILSDGLVYLTDAANPARPRDFLKLSFPASVLTLHGAPNGSRLHLRIAGESRVLAWDLSTRAVSTIYDFGATGIGLVAAGTNRIAALTAGSVLLVDTRSGRTDSFPLYDLGISELAIPPDGSDIIVSAIRPGGPVSSDLFRLGQ
jgi:WD40-like Beta Propeller Repeat